MKSSNSSHQEDLDLLLSLQDRVLETPPASPSHPHSHSPDDGSPRCRGQADLSVFRNVVEGCLDYEPKPVDKQINSKLKRPMNSNDDHEVDKFSGLRIRNRLLSPADLSEHFSDIRFVRLSTIKNLLRGDTLSGCWATVGVLTERGNPKTSSIGQTYCTWKIGCLDESTISIFLFGDAYQQNCREQAGTVFALFNCTVRKDTTGTGFSLSVQSPNQMLKMGTSVDYGVCKGRRKDGMACPVIINKRRGIYCKYHKSKASEGFTTTRTELKGGNLRTAFRDRLHAEGVYLVDPLADRTNSRKPNQPTKILSVEGLRKALSNAGKVTTNAHSQGIRFLTEITGRKGALNAREESLMRTQHVTSLEKRKSSTVKMDPSEVARHKQQDAKRKKTEQGQALADKSKQGSGKMIELDFVSSDEEI
ncbi:zf-primase domain-containing protein [Cephalotus follicularis]|uniref:Zf-primase domain-containing protein n=1 Tax=Cephalotus follicularis TaxID=3775 RepID=A0A1Q3B4V3_CEPFO|nr:zf-primase domain-containing protein [Cephalotus follicularis]